jgi:hypothetical protein
VLDASVERQCGTPVWNASVERPRVFYIFNMKMTLFTHVGNCEKLFSKVITFADGRLPDHHRVDLTEIITDRLIDDEKSVCNALKDGRIFFYSESRNSDTASGGIGWIRDGERLNIVTLGTSWNETTWIWYPIATYAKRLIESVPGGPFNISVIRHDSNVEYSSVDSVHEAIVGALLSHLYDSGVAPSVMRYFSMYPCGDRRRLFVMERSQFRFDNLLLDKEYNDLFLSTTASDFRVWLCQLYHTLYVVKHYFGITNSDVHMANIMFTYVGRPVDSLSSPAVVVNTLETPYSKQYLSKVHSYEYELPRQQHAATQYLRVFNNGYLPKIIDWGISRADFSRSVIYGGSTTNISFVSTDEHTDIFQAVESLEDAGQAGDLEANYITLQLAGYFYRMTLGLYVSEAVQAHAIELWENGLEVFLESLLGAAGYNLSEILTNPYTPPTVIRGGHPVKLVEPLISLDPDPDGYFISARAVGTTSDITAPLRRLVQTLELYPDPNISLLATKTNSSTDEVTLRIPLTATRCSSNITAMIDSALDDVRYVSVLNTSFCDYHVDHSSKLWSSADQELKQNISRVDLVDYFNRPIAGIGSLYTLKLDPAHLNLGRVSDVRAEHAYPIHAITVTCHIVYLNSNIRMVVNSPSTAGAFTTYALPLAKDIRDQLYHGRSGSGGKSRDDSGRAKGDSDRVRSAALYATLSGKLKLISSADFIHLMDKQSAQIPIDTRIPNSPSEKQIDYNTVLEIGPVLVWNGILQYTPDKKADSPITSYSVLCQSTDGQMFIFYIEGRGFDAPGLDLAELLRLLSYFRMRHAVVISSDDNVNALLHGDTWLINSPARPPDGTQLTFFVDRQSPGRRKQKHTA